MCFLSVILTSLETQYAHIFADCSGKVRSKPASLKEYFLKYAYFKCENKKLIVEPSQEDQRKLRSALFVDFEHFYIKSKIQYIDYLVQVHSSRTWNIVTYYYFLFFCITTLCKYTGHACIFFKQNELKQIKEHIITLDNISLETGLYTYLVERNGDQLRISLQKDEKRVHERTWNLFYNLIADLTKKIKTSSTELMLIRQVKKFMDKYGENFPSMIRNAVNYQGYYSVEELKNDIPPIIPYDLNKIFIIDPKAKDDMARRLECSMYIGIFIHKLLQELQKDINCRLKTKHNEFDELQKRFCSNCYCDTSTFDNLFNIEVKS